MSDTVAQALAGYRYDMLLHMANLASLGIMTSKGQKLGKEALIALLVEHLFTPARANAVLPEAGELARVILDRLALRQGSGSMTELRRELATDGIVSAGEGSHIGVDLWLDASLDPFDAAVTWLTVHGLILILGSSLRTAGSARPGQRSDLVLTIPSTIYRALPIPRLSSAEWGGAPLPMTVSAGDIDDAQRDLFLYWSYARSHPIPLTQSGRVQKRALRALEHQTLVQQPLSEAPEEEGAPRLHFQRHLLQELGLLGVSQGKLAPQGSRDRVFAFWDYAAHKRTCFCCQAWLRMVAWSELSAETGVGVDIDVSLGRRLLFKELASLPADTWFSADRFLRRLLTAVPPLLFPPRSASRQETEPGEVHWYDQHPARKNRWFAEVEATFVGRVISGPLHWLGLVDVAAEDTRVLAFRPNASLKAVWAQLGQQDGRWPNVRDLDPFLGARVDSSTDGRIVVQPNFQVLALGRVPDAILARLEMFGKRIRADRSTIEYALSRESVYRALQDGVEIAEIVTFLEGASTAAVPQNVLRSLEEWSEHHQRIRFHRDVTLCMAASEQLMGNVWDAPETASHLARRLTPTVSMVHSGHQAPLVEQLVHLGFLPAIASLGVELKRCVEIEPDGHVVLDGGAQNIVLESELSRLAERRDGQYYITRSAVAAAESRGMELADYLKSWQRLSRSGLPEKLAADIQTWTGTSKVASLRRALVLRLPDLAAAEALLADPELQPYLSRLLPDGPSPMLQVSNGNEAALAELLRKRGYRVEEQRG